MLLRRAGRAGWRVEPCTRASRARLTARSSQGLLHSLQEHMQHHRRLHVSAGTCLLTARPKPWGRTARPAGACWLRRQDDDGLPAEPAVHPLRPGGPHLRHEHQRAGEPASLQLPGSCPIPARRAGPKAPCHPPVQTDLRLGGAVRAAAQPKTPPPPALNATLKHAGLAGAHRAVGRGRASQRADGRAGLPHGQRACGQRARRCRP